MDNFQKYLIVINIISFLISTVAVIVTKKKGNGEKLCVLRGLLAFIGGAAGVILAFVLWDRKFTKQNMTLNVLSVSFFIIQAVILLFIYGPYEITLKGIFDNLILIDKRFIIYLIAINLFVFLLFGIDKRKAVKEKSRIPIVVLLFFSLIGGSVGGMLAMYLFRHKTQKLYFSLGMPMILLAQTVLIAYIVGAGFLS